MTEFTWSYSSLKEFQNCPKKYYEIRVAQNYVSKDTEATIYGKEVHKALEDYVRDGKELAENYLKYKEMVDVLRDIPGIKYCEHEMALDRAKQPCDFNDENRWVRGIADLLIVDGDYAFIVDYKTGSHKYADPKQLRLMSLMTFAHFPEVKKIKGGLLFVSNNHFVQEEYLREDIDKSWKHFEQPLQRLKNSYELNAWVPNPTPLCRFCPVTSCDFNKS